MIRIDGRGKTEGQGHPRARAVPGTHVASLIEGDREGTTERTDGDVVPEEPAEGEPQVRNVRQPHVRTLETRSSP
jgi:hypothetical protein